MNIKQPTIYLRTKQLYLLNEARKALAAETIEIPYIRYFENVFSINNLDYLPLEKGGVVLLKKVLDANFTVERLITYFRNTTNVDQNRLWNFRNSLAADGQFYNTLELIIAGQSREGPWTPLVYDTIVTDAKEERTSAAEIATLDFSRGWRIEDVPSAVREPTGGINFSTADRPTLYVDLRNVEFNVRCGVRQVQMFSLAESWALFKVKDGKGKLEYAN